tara:strand:+ start:247 stop:438 length:192 start_codon:yes stop_codon:yes gene_type:complete
MKLYDTYKEASENSEGFEVLTPSPDWVGCPSCLGKFIINRPSSDGGFPHIAADAWMVVYEEDK